MVAAHSDNLDGIPMTVAEYLQFEDEQEFKHEYANGRVYAMTGGSIRHGVISATIIRLLGNHLEDKDCTVSSPDTRIKVEEMKSFRYPDAVVFCGDAQYADNRSDTLGNPILIVEVLSPSTALTDRNDKLKEYTASATLQEYVLVSQHEARVEVFTRQATGQWIYTPVSGMDANVELASIGYTLELRRVYSKVTLDEE